MAKNQKAKNVSLTMDDKYLTLLDDLCKKEKRSASNMVAFIVMSYLDNSLDIVDSDADSVKTKSKANKGTVDAK